MSKPGGSLVRQRLDVLLFGSKMNDGCTCDMAPLFIKSVSVELPSKIQSRLHLRIKYVLDFPSGTLALPKKCFSWTLKRFDFSLEVLCTKSSGGITAFKIIQLSIKNLVILIYWRALQVNSHINNYINKYVSVIVNSRTQTLLQEQTASSIKNITVMKL